MLKKEKKQKKKYEEMSKQELIQEIVKYVAVIIGLIIVTVLLNIYTDKSKTTNNNIIDNSQIVNSEENEIDMLYEKQEVEVINQEPNKLDNQEKSIDIINQEQLEKDLLEEQQIYQNYLKN